MRSVISGMLQYEDTARSLWTDRAFNYLAGIRRLELGTFVATLVAIRMILVVDGYFGDFGCAFAWFGVAPSIPAAPITLPSTERRDNRANPAAGSFDMDPSQGPVLVY
jgi:hypothetical protein